MPTPLNVALICRIKDKVLRVPSYSRTRLATASPHAIGMLYVSAVARGCSIVGKDSSRGGAEVAKETFVDRLVKANWYCSCSNIGSVSEELGSILEVSGDKDAGDSGRISLRLFGRTKGCDRMEFGVCFLFIRGPNKCVFVSRSYNCWYYS